MRSVAVLPSIALLAGAYAGIPWAVDLRSATPLLVGLWIVAAVSWARDAPVGAVVAASAAPRVAKLLWPARDASAGAAAETRSGGVVTMLGVVSGYALAGAMLGAAAAREALAPSLRTVLDGAYGRFSLETLGPAGSHEPLLTRVRLVDDAAKREFGVSLDAQVEAIRIDDKWRSVDGGLRLTVTGDVAVERAAGWRAGRLVQAPVTFRRPARYLDEGVADFERELALAGVALHGSVKSGLLVEVIAPGTALQEATAEVRAHVRAAVQRWIAVHDSVAASIVVAILIGDRTTLPDTVRERLQAAGTYHVIAISGGNIAILAALVAGALFLVGASGRASALAVIGGLGAYACVVTAGPSVARATVMAIVYVAARLLDHRSPPWNAMAVSASLLACAAPLDVRDVGFALTFGATGAILEAARRTRLHESKRGAHGAARHSAVLQRRLGRAPVFWITASVAASFATEVVLLPIGATAFSRVTIAGLVLNLVAVPLMTVTQVAGLAVVMLDRVGPLTGPAASLPWVAPSLGWLAGAAESLAWAAGIVAAAAAHVLVESARLVELLPWLALRVPPPAPLLVAAYYGFLASALWLQRVRVVASVLLIACCGAVLTGLTSRIRADDLTGRLRLTTFDVGQGDALLLQTPDGRSLMVDAGGAGFDASGFDVGSRVLAPALWARGVMRLDTLAITHADPDHIGGALALVRDFGPSEIWHGVEMPHHAPSQTLLEAGLAAGAVTRQRLAGWTRRAAGFEIRVLHPPQPDWERPRVRNDDSLVLDVRFGNVAILLTGDVGADVERTLLPKLSPAPIRILKVGHHGSRTSTSQALLDAWRPQVAVISCGRGNRFGHPAPEVIRRLEGAGVRIYRTDRDGQITVDTDGRTVAVRTHRSATKP